MTQIGQRIREARIRRSWSQARLAEAAAVSQPTVANWENGSHSPREAAMERLSHALQVHRLWLLEGQINGHGHDSAPSPAADEGYFSTPILHVPVLAWPQGPDVQEALSGKPLRHLAAAIQAQDPFALDCDDVAVSRAFPATSTIIFDRAVGPLQDGGFYLFVWKQRVLVRRWRSQPDRFEPAGDPGRFETIFPKDRPIVLGRAILALRCLVDHKNHSANSQHA